MCVVRADTVTGRVCAVGKSRSRESALTLLTGIERGYLLIYTAGMQVMVGGSLTGIKGKVKGQKWENVSRCWYRNLRYYTGTYC